jgi:hypothetical protein
LSDTPICEEFSAQKIGLVIRYVRITNCLSSTMEFEDGSLAHAGFDLGAWRERFTRNIVTARLWSSFKEPVDDENATLIDRLTFRKGSKPATWFPAVLLKAFQADTRVRRAKIHEWVQNRRETAIRFAIRPSRSPGLPTRWRRLISGHELVVSHGVRATNT